MNKALTLIQLFNFADWIVAFFISGTAARIQGKGGRRTPLAVGLAIFFGLFGLIRFGEFINIIVHMEELTSCLGLSIKYSQNAVLISGVKTLAIIFCWFCVTIEERERRGVLSGNMIRNFLTRWFDKLR